MKRLPLATLLALLALPTPAWAGAEGPGTPQATAANATFLSNAPVPPSGRGICVIDTGVDTDTDLGSALVSRTTTLGSGGSTDPGDYGTISDTGEPMSKHGTYVAGIIASQIDGKGTSGIWPAAKIYSARVFAGGSATAQVNDYINAIDWCRQQPGVKVINLSLSGLAGATTAQRASLDNIIEETRGVPFNVNVVAAAGNGGSTATVGYPASSAGVLAIGATDASGALTAFTNRGAGLDISTFGLGSCLTTSHDTNLATGHGTSYAAPVVSAVLAAIRSYDPSLSPDQAEQLLLTNADFVAGVRVVNAAKTFRAVPAIAALAATAPTLGSGSVIANPCEASPAIANGAGAASEVPAPPEQTTRPTDIEVTALAGPAPVVDVSPPTSNHPAVAVRRAARPVLRSLSYRRGILAIRIGGYETGDKAVYEISYRAHGLPKSRNFVRMADRLRVRIPNWELVRVRLVRPTTGTSRTIVIRPRIEF